MKLTNLDLRHTKVTDAGLKELAPLKASPNSISGILR